MFGIKHLLSRNAPRAQFRRNYAKCHSLQEAVSYVKSNDRIFVQGNAAYPWRLVEALMDRSAELRNVELFKGTLCLGPAPYLDQDKYKGVFKSNSIFIGKNVREAVNNADADYTPCNLHDVPDLITSGLIPIDVAFLHLSPPDLHGYCSYGVEVTHAIAAAESAKMVIAQINPNMPRTLGDSFIHISNVHHWVEVNDELYTYHGEDQPVFSEIGRHIAGIIKDKDCIQLGIGALPNGVLPYLKDKWNLGMHTEMFSDGVVELVNRGNINGMHKNFHHGKVLTSFCMGSKKLYEFVHDCPLFDFHPTDYTNLPANVGKNDNMVAVNAAIEVDLTGQVCAESIGPRFYSGVGGQLDFVRGASMSKGGRPIMALPSTQTLRTGQVVSKIVPRLKHGAGVTVTRFDIHWVATEYGIVNLHGKTIKQRAKALIELSHPSFREELEIEAHKLKYL